jgi:hypothetical protein
LAIKESLPPHTDMEHCSAFRRDADEYGDVTLSVQASWGRYCKLAEEFIPADHADHWDRGRLGCAHVPLEHYESVEIALWFTDEETGLRRGWITKPSEALGINGFDDIWNGDDVAGWVPLRRVGELQVALMSRAAKLEHSRD